jgi:hypothetical protein
VTATWQTCEERETALLPVRANGGTGRMWNARHCRHRYRNERRGLGDAGQPCRFRRGGRDRRACHGRYWTGCQCWLGCPCCCASFSWRLLGRGASIRLTACRWRPGKTIFRATWWQRIAGTRPQRQGYIRMARLRFDVRIPAVAKSTNATAAAICSKGGFLAISG